MNLPRRDPPGPGAAEAIGAQVRAARKARGLSIRGAAEHLGCSPRFVHELERGKPGARLDKLLQVAAGLGLSVAASGAAQPAAGARGEARLRQRLHEEKLALAHARIAARLALGERGAADIGRARAQVRKWDEQRICSKWYVERWRRLLRGAGRGVAARLLALDPADARALFQNTPFGFLVRAELRA